MMNRRRRGTGCHHIRRRWEGDFEEMSWMTALKLAGLRVDLRVRPSYFDRWFDCRVVIDAFPFGGTLETIFVDEQLVEFADALDALDPVGAAVLGGDRAAELRLHVEHQNDDREGLLAIECSVTPSGDDPYPYLRWLIFGVGPFAEQTSRRLREIAAIDPWPKP
jgi:hypothetical protein